MKITVTCRECSQPIIIVLSNKKIFIATCENNHTNCIAIQSSFFELFFDLGCLAFLDGYYREAVFNFHSALETFREHFIKFSLSKKDIPDKSIKEMWKEMAAQSERQLGAYQILYLLMNNTNIDSIQKLSKIRNEVIYKGKIPSTEETKEFGELKIIF